MSRPKLALFVLALAALAVLSTGSTLVGARPGNADSPAYVPGEVIVKFKSLAQPLDKAAARTGLNALEVVEFQSKAQHWRLGPGVDVETAVQRLAANPLVEYAEPNYLWTLDVIPNDPRLDELWGMINNGQTGGTPDADIDAELAWNVSTGSPDVIVGVIDTGVDYNHPELAANIWSNPGEIAGNGIDDDSNGYIDDTRGWDFYNNDNNPFDDHGHGTHVSGTITAIGDNGIGVAGVAWHVKVMPLKFLSAGGSGPTTGAVLAVQYATMMGADLTSNSWGGGAYSQALYDAIQAAGAVEQAFVAAAGNDGLNSDVSPHYPSSYNLPNIISVAATDHNDAKASFSNYGAVSVDLGAPGVNVLSTLPGNSYGLGSGTSMATPHVSGVAALIRSVSPSVPISQMKNIILTMADDIPSMAGITVSGGRLNAFFAIAEPDDIAPDPIVDLAAGTPTSNTMGLTWTATGDDGSVGTASYYEVRYSLAPIDDTSWPMATLAPNAPPPNPSGSPESMEVAGLEADTTYYFAIKAFDEWANASPLSNLAMGTTLPPPTGDVAPTSISEALFTGGTADRTVMLSNIGLGTLDFTIPTPTLGDPVIAQEPLILGKDEIDPRSGDPITEGMGGPDPFGYRWVDSDEPGGPVFNWIDISTTGTAVGATSDDSLSPAITLDFDFPFYGQFFDTIRVCSNGWLSFTSSATSYSNQPLPNSGAPENLVAPFWDDLNPGGVSRIFYQSFGTYAVVQWHEIVHYGTTADPYTFQAILDSSGAITYQYLTMAGQLDSSTIGIQDATKTVALQVAYNQVYLHDNLAIRIAAIPQWLTAAPTSGRLWAGESMPINVHIDAANLEGGTYPGQVNILTNDPAHPVLTVDVTLDVTGAPDAVVTPAALDYGDRFLMQPAELTLTVRNAGTDALVVSDITTSHGDLAASPTAFSLSPRETQDVTVTWMPSALGPFTGNVTVFSNDASQPSIVVPVTGNAIPAPEIIVSPTSFTETLYTGETVTRALRVSNAGGSDLVVDAATFLGEGGLVVANDEGTTGSGGPDAFGYKWKDSDEPGGPVFNFIDISETGSVLVGSGVDDRLSAAVDMGMTFPFYGTNFTQFKVSTNGWLTFNTAETSTRYSNSNLPSTSGAAFMVATFWDDLHTRNGDVRWLNDGQRVIVQYTNIEKLSPSGSPLTFQVQLYPSGKILMMYQTMAGTLNSATIGIQDGTKTIGLPVVYNANYVHSGLAIQISTTPDWLVVTPSHAVIPPGAFADFDVNFDATDRVGGTLNGAVVLMTNIPDTPEVQLPATLNVIGAPVAGVIPESYDYGTRFVGYSHLTNFQVVNSGTDVLNVDLVDTTDPTLVVSEEPSPGDETPQAVISIPPGGARLFTLQWVPTAPGPLSAAVQVHSDDPTHPLLLMPVTGNAILPPVAAWSPSSFSEDLMVGDVVARTLHLENQGASDLEFVTQLRDLTTGPVAVYPDIKIGDDEEDPRPGILGSGGPDAFGYKWKDSDEIGGPVFDWVDISSVGTLVPFSSYTSGQNLGPYPIGFNFPFYGNTFDEFRICSNGWVSFTNSSTDSTNDPLPTTGAPENLLAAFWDSMIHDTSYGSAVYYHFDGTRTIVQYSDIRKSGYTTSPFFTFQIILYPSGNVVYQYLTLGAAPLNSHTIGIQNATQDDGLTVVFNDDTYIHEGLAIRFQALDWLAVAPTSGTIPPGGALDLDVVIDTSSLVGGDYAASIDITTNDPAHAVIAVPVDLHTTGIPDISADPTSLSFPTTFVGYASSLPLSILNVGTDVLHVSGVSASGDFASGGLALPVDLPPGGSVSLAVDFMPTTDGMRTGTLSISSDDPDEPLFEVALEGPGLFPPIAVWAPASFTEDLFSGDVVTRTLHLENQGGSDLHFATSLRDLGSSAVTVYPEIVLGEGEEDPRPGVLGSGGPDDFGYTWTDSDEPGGPLFDWFDITPVGTLIDFSSYTSGQNLGPYPIGFDFPFYGTTFSEFQACSNGWISFTSTSTDSSNDPLPTTGAPENLLAAFWDSMIHDESDNSSVYYYYDGTKTIIQYNNLRKSGYMTAPFFTFQIILHPSGTIDFQYLTLDPDAPWNSHTIGIQNATQDDGLTVVYNDASYIHEGLAIRFQALKWLEVSPPTGTLPAGGTLDLDVTVDTTELLGGDYAASIDMMTNDPAHAVIEIPVNLHVTAIPNIAADPASLTFPGTYLGFSSSLPLSIRNVGAEVLHISAVSVSGDFAQTGLTPPLDIPAKSAVPVTVDFIPSTDGVRTGAITIVSDDPDTPVFEVPLEGLGVIPPEIGSTPDEITTALPPGGSRTKTLTLHNTGGSDLEWVAMPSIVASAGSVTVYDYLELAKDEEDPRVGILGSGGPDLYGYRWKDSDEAGGPVFDWFDISGVGTPIFSGYTDDGNAGPFPIGFNFNFYGADFSQFYACTNGWVSFTSTKTTYSNQPLPNSGTAVPENLLAVFWDDLVHRSGTGSEPVPSETYYYFDGTRLIIQYSHMYRIANYTDDINFQVILYPSGKIVYQYETMVVSDPDTQTVGIQNATKDDGLTVVYNDLYLHENMAVQFSRFPDWVTLDPMVGVIPAGGSQDLIVTLDAAGLEDGIHEASLDFLSNDPYTPLYQVPVSLNVSMVDTNWTNFDPDVLNLTANGNFVSVYVELPPDLDPYAINLSSVYLNDTVPALASPAPEYDDRDGNGIIDVMFKFDRAAVQALLPEGAEVPVWITGEVLDVQWWRGMDMIRTMNPRVTSPPAAAYYLSDAIVPIRWEAPDSVTPTYYAVHLSRDGGTSWEELATGVTGLGLDWTATGLLSENARVRVLAFDNQGLLGYDTNDGAFTIAGPALLPPNPVDGATLELVLDTEDLVIAWKEPLADLGHGPADSYRVLRSEVPSGPYTEVAVVPEPVYREPLALTADIPVLFYRIVASNVAGEAE